MKEVYSKAPECTQQSEKVEILTCLYPPSREQLIVSGAAAHGLRAVAVVSEQVYDLVNKLELISARPSDVTIITEMPTFDIHAAASLSSSLFSIWPAKC